MIFAFGAKIYMSSISDGTKEIKEQAERANHDKGLTPGHLAKRKVCDRDHKNQAHKY